MRTAQALYGLHMDAFIEGIASEAPKPEAFGLSEKQAQDVRAKRYADRIRAKRRAA